MTVSSGPIARKSPSAYSSARPAYAGWLLIGLAVGLMVLIELAAQAEPSWRARLAYTREGISHGQYWRLLTSHWVHWNTTHLVGNAVGSIVLALLFFRTYTVGRWIVAIAASVAAIDIGFVLFDTQVNYYVGASGVLHGVWAAGSVAMLLRRDRRMLLSAIATLTRPSRPRYVRRLVAGAVAVGVPLTLIAKLTWEQTHGSLHITGEMPVLVNAHLFGALGGLTAACAMEGYRGWRRRAAHL